jgi:hypothetical protein
MRFTNMGLIGGNGKSGGFDEADSLNASEKKRVIDEEAGVVIYAVAPQGGWYGLTDIPIDETDLEI